MKETERRVGEAGVEKAYLRSRNSTREDPGARRDKVCSENSKQVGWLPGALRED